jgi:hypothetical protein
MLTLLFFYAITDFGIWWVKNVLVVNLILCSTHVYLGLFLTDDTVISELAVPLFQLDNELVRQLVAILFIVY